MVPPPCTVWSIVALVLQSTVPLLIASFAFNFNNFSLIYMLIMKDPGMDVGQTDILISMVWQDRDRVGFPNYGLARPCRITHLHRRMGRDRVARFPPDEDPWRSCDECRKVTKKS